MVTHCKIKLDSVRWKAKSLHAKVKVLTAAAVDQCVKCVHVMTRPMTFGF